MNHSHIGKDAVQTQPSARDIWIMRLLVSLISLTVISMGVLNIVLEHYYGRSSKLGGAELTLDGWTAVTMGIAMCCFGMLPLAVWFNHKRHALVWSLCCVAGMGVFLSVTMGLNQPNPWWAPQAQVAQSGGGK